MELIPSLTSMLLWLHQTDINWSEYWVGVIIGWVIILGILGYVYVVVRHEQ